MLNQLINLKYIKINNNEYYDGGLCDPIPIRKSISDGNKKHLIVLTQPKGYKKELSKKTLLYLNY